jgi:hypothetical protein
MSMAQFRTRERANQPARVFLIDPATGNTTEDWLDIRSSLSDAFRQAKDRCMQDAAELTAEQDETRRREGVAEIKRRMYVALLAGWSFDEPFSEDAAYEFLREAPQVEDVITAVADSRERFFGDSSVT